MVLDLLLTGLAIALEPFPLTAFILILSAEKGTRKGLAYILGWLACLVVVIAAVLLVTGGQPPAANTAPSTAVLAVKLNVGKAVEESLLPKQVKRSARGAQIILIRVVVAEEFRRVVSAEAEVFCQKP